MPKFGTLLLLSVLFVSACSENFGETLTISAIGENPHTKTSLAQNNSIVFTSNDSLAIFDGAGMKKFNIVTLYEDGSADFQGSVTEPATKYIAVYPYQNIIEKKSDEAVEITIPTTQKATDNTFDPVANVSVGITQSITQESHSLSLKNVCSLIKFSVPEGTSYKYVILKPNGSEYLTGRMSCTISDTPSLTPVESGKSPLAILDGNVEGGNWYYIAVNPTTLAKGFSIYLFDVQSYGVDLSNCTPIRSTNSSVTLKRSDILNIGILGAEPGAAFTPLAGETVFVW